VNKNLKGLAAKAAEEWGEAPQGWTAGYVVCTECRHHYISVHPFGLSVLECPNCKNMTRHNEEESL